MKKQRVLSGVLALTIIGGTLFGGGALKAYADELDGSKNNNVSENIEEEITNIAEYSNELAKNGFISDAEAKRLVELETKLDKIFADLADNEEISDEKDQKINQIIDELSLIYEKAYDNKFYQELRENKVLTEDEISKYKEAEKQINAIYEFATEDSNFDELDKKSDAIYQANKAIFDKVDQYYTKLDQMELNDYYDELVKSGDITKEQVEQLKIADQKVDELFANLSEDPSDQELDELNKKIEEIYKDIDFIDYFDCEDEDVMLY